MDISIKNLINRDKKVFEELYEVRKHQKEAQEFKDSGHLELMEILFDKVKYSSFYKKTNYTKTKIHSILKSYSSSFAYSDPNFKEIFEKEWKKEPLSQNFNNLYYIYNEMLLMDLIHYFKITPTYSENHYFFDFSPYINQEKKLYFGNNHFYFYSSEELFNTYKKVYQIEDFYKNCFIENAKLRG